MKIASKKAVESTVSKAMGKFLKEHLGEHPEKVTTQISGDLIMVRFREQLPPAERHMIRHQEGMKMIKELKVKLIERAAPLIKILIEELTGSKVVDIHSDVNLDTGERIEIFTLNEDFDPADMN